MIGRIYIATDNLAGFINCLCIVNCKFEIKLDSPFEVNIGFITLFIEVL